MGLRIVALSLARHGITGGIVHSRGLVAQAANTGPRQCCVLIQVYGTCRSTSIYSTSLQPRYFRNSSPHATVAHLLNMAQELASLNPVEESADDIFQLLKISGHSTIFVDQHGDLDVVVGTGEESRTFCVCKAAMRLMSPVWRAMLSTEYNFMEASSTTCEITFPEDDVASFFIVLLAGHLRFMEIPKSINRERLLNVCIIGDKYDCITVLRPWLTVWVSSVLKNFDQKKSPSDWVMIAWVTGHESLFKIAANELVISCNVDDTQQCLARSGTSLEGRLPFGLNGQYSSR